MSENAIKICLDSQDGEAIGYLEVPNTGSDDKYKNVTVEIKNIHGVHHLLFAFSEKSSNLIVGNSKNNIIYEPSFVRLNC